jgi:hypothetical protein
MFNSICGTAGLARPNPYRLVVTAAVCQWGNIETKRPVLLLLLSHPFCTLIHAAAAAAPAQPVHTLIICACAKACAKGLMLLQHQKLNNQA